jgi:sugar porter (SP) family MFS transporter
MFTGGIVIIVGAILTSTSNSVAQFVVGRFVLGAGIMFMTVSAPAYAIEMAPPHWRGRAVGFYNCGWFGGSIPAAFITYGCQHINSNLSWRIPLILQCFTCIIVIVAVFFMPESPRYLMSKGDDEKAFEILTKYHGDGNRNARLVLLEIEEIRENLRQDQLYGKSPWDWRPLFATNNTRWRTLQAIMMGIFGQFSGNGLGYYNPAIFNLLGVTSPFQQLGYNVVNSVISAVGALTAMSLTDRMPRRKVLVWGTLASAAMLCINASLQTSISHHEIIVNGTTVITNISMAKAALAFYFFFNIIYSFAYTPLQGVLPAEALDTRLRAKGLAMYGLVVNIFGFINLYATPIALNNIQYKFIWIFVGWDCLEALLWYIFWYVSTFLGPTPLFKINVKNNLSLRHLSTKASNPRVAPLKSSSGFITNPTLSRPPYTSTRSWCRPTALLLRRSLITTATESVITALVPRRMKTGCILTIFPPQIVSSLGI